MSGACGDYEKALRGDAERLTGARLQIDHALPPNIIPNLDHGAMAPDRWEALFQESNPIWPPHPMLPKATRGHNRPG